MSATGTIESIFAAAAKGAPMQRVAVATLVAGRGIRGDRNFRDVEHDAQITLIAAEEVDRFNRETGLGIEAGDARRNVVTRGVALHELVDTEFRVGETILIGVELCEPCAKLGKRLASSAVSPAQVVAAFVHRAGLRARIVTGGRIASGDHVGR